MSTPVIASALLFEGRVVTYIDHGGELSAWCEGKEIRVTSELREAILADQEKQAHD